MNDAPRPAPWSPVEDRLVVRDYLQMQAAVARGEKINKAATRRALLPQLNNRSEGSVEMKRMNISAVLVSIGRPFLPGYQPAKNFQRSLVTVVQAEVDAMEGRTAA
jgi:hypothetical protein